MIRKIMSVLSAIILAMSLMLTVVNATASLAVLQGNVPAPGEEFDIHVVLSDNPGLKSLQCMVTYDANSAILVSCADGEYFDSFTQIPTEGGMLLVWSSDAENDNYSNGILATITFKATSQPADGSLITVTVLDAQNASGSITVDGSTNIMQFVVEEFDDDIVSADDEDDGSVSVDDDEDVVEGEEDEEEEDVIYADDEEEEVTTASTTQTKATTTTKKTSATTTTEKKTSATTTTASQTTTTEATTETTPETTPEVTSTTPQSSSEQSISFSGDAHTVAAQKKKANGSTVFAAVMIVGITVAAIAGMEIWKKGEDNSSSK